MNQCSQCQGFVPTQLAHCPHCEVCVCEGSPHLKRAAKVAVGMGLSLSLSACLISGPTPAYGISIASPSPTVDCEDSGAKPEPTCPDINQTLK